MTLKEKFKEILTAFWTSEWESECEVIADEFAVGFAEWVVWKRNFDKEIYHLSSYKELLEIYKKENEL